MVAKLAIRDREVSPSTLLSQEALLESLRAINLDFLKLMSDFARTSYYSLEPLGSLAPLFLEMTPELASQASQFPFLLLDLHFSESSWWNRETFGERVAVKETAHGPAHIATRATSIARSALMLAWHTVRTERDASLVLLGLSSVSADAIGSMSLHDLEGVALLEPVGIRPRWSNSHALWVQLLSRPHAQQVDVARDFVLHALQLTAGSYLR